MDIRGYPPRILADTNHGSEARSDPPNGYLPLFKSAGFAADTHGYPPFLADHDLIGHFSPWLPWLARTCAERTYGYGRP